MLCLVPIDPRLKEILQTARFQIRSHETHPLFNSFHRFSTPRSRGNGANETQKNETPDATRRSKKKREKGIALISATNISPVTRNLAALRPIKPDPLIDPKVSSSRLTAALFACREFSTRSRESFILQTRPDEDK